MDTEDRATPDGAPDPEDAVREVIAALREPGAVNAGFAAALIGLLETTLEHDRASNERRDRDDS